MIQVQVVTKGMIGCTCAVDRTTPCLATEEVHDTMNQLFTSEVNCWWIFTDKLWLRNSRQGFTWLNTLDFSTTIPVVIFKTLMVVVRHAALYVFVYFFTTFLKTRRLKTAFQKFSSAAEGSFGACASAGSVLHLWIWSSRFQLVRYKRQFAAKNVKGSLLWWWWWWWWRQSYCAGSDSLDRHITTQGAFIVKSEETDFWLMQAICPI